MCQLHGEGEMTGGKASASGKPSGLFPKNMIHLGGDEVDTSCWEKTPEVAAWLTAHNMTADQVGNSLVAPGARVLFRMHARSLLSSM